MHVKRTVIIIAASALLLLFITNILQCVLFTVKINKIKNSSEMQIVQLEKVISNIGPIDKVWTVNKKVDAGERISTEDLVSIEILEKSKSDSYILDLNELEGKYYKVSILPGTPLTNDIVMEEELNDSLRQYDVVANIIPIGLKEGDYVDYRFVMPGGEDYIAMAHKRVEGVYDNTITFNMTEEEIHLYQSLLIDYFLQEGSSIYMTKYIEPGVQRSAIEYYPISENILETMLIDPNIEEFIEADIIKELRSEMSTPEDLLSDENIRSIEGGRKSIQNDINQGNSDYWSEVEDMQEELNQSNSYNGDFNSEANDNEFLNIQKGIIE